MSYQNKNLSHFLFPNRNILLSCSWSTSCYILYGLSRYSVDSLHRSLTHLSVPDLAVPGRTSPGTVRRQPGRKRRKHPRLQEQEGRRCSTPPPKVFQGSKQQQQHSLWRFPKKDPQCPRSSPQLVSSFSFFLFFYFLPSSFQLLSLPSYFFTSLILYVFLKWGHIGKRRIVSRCKDKKNMAWVLFYQAPYTIYSLYLHLNNI